MKKVRLFVLKGTTKSFIDVPLGAEAEVSADIEVEGGKIYHAILLTPPRKKRRATLSKRLY